VKSIDEIVSVQVDWEVNAAVVTTRDGLADLERKTGKRTATTGCGQGTVFGDLMEDIESVKLDDDMRVDEQTLFGLLDAVRVHESIYKQAGAVHGCALAQGAASSPSSRTWAATTRSTRSPVDVARGNRRARQDLLHHRAPHLGDGDQGRADGHSRAGVALRAHENGPRDRRAAWASR
jgi:hypothetical protein